MQILRGKELFNTSIGPEGTNDNARKPAGRMSDSGWGSCYGCHPRGLTDGVTCVKRQPGARHETRIMGQHACREPAAGGTCLVQRK